MARRYDSGGTPTGAGFQVNTTATGDMDYPSVVGLVGGGFVLDWRSKDENDAVYARRYDSGGGAQGQDFRVDDGDADRSGSSWSPGLAPTLDGGFLATWEAASNHNDVRGRYYDHDGTGGAPFTVHDFVSDTQWRADAAMLADGAIAIDWESGKPHQRVRARELVPPGTTGAASLTVSTAYVHTDQLGTPQVLTDADQTVVWMANYMPFGQATITTGIVTNNLRFPGQYFDTETGMHYNYFRDYDASLGRYLQSDPIGIHGGLNTYLYALANPIRSVDIYGLESITSILRRLLTKPFSNLGGNIGEAISNEMKGSRLGKQCADNFCGRHVIAPPPENIWAECLSIYTVGEAGSDPLGVCFEDCKKETYSKDFAERCSLQQGCRSQNPY